MEHSLVDPEFGESDLTVYVEMGDARYALLIENKIDATYEANGSYDEVTYCSDCNTELEREKMQIKREMEKLGYDEVEFDGLGNVIGWMGTGDKIIAIDSHIDTVEPGDPAEWGMEDPLKAIITEDGCIDLSVAIPRTVEEIEALMAK